MAEPIVGESFKCTYSHLEREIGYLVHFRTNVANLRLQVELLAAKRSDVKEQIRHATMNGEAILKTVETWLSTAEDVLVRARNLDEKAAAVNQWFKGWFCARFVLGRRAQKEILIVQWLLDKVDAFGERLSYRRHVQDLITAPLEVVNAIGGSISDEITVQNLMTTPSKDANATVDKTSDERHVHNQVFLTGDSTSSEEVKAFGARLTTAKRVIEALKNDGTSLFGVYGMPGVGKTTLISALAIYVKEKKIFDEVVVVTLTQIPEIRYIQGDIANGLGLKFDDDDSLSTRALRLSRRLSDDRKTLIVLDNLWKELALAEVGIPQGVKKCKVLFTTRDRDVCNSMDTGESRIKVDVLSPEDSWDLFRKKTGDTVDSPVFQSVAKDVLNECQGLPLLIVTLGKALYQKDRTYWDAALQALHDSTILPNPNFPGLPKVFSVMKLSYDYLESEETKICFLICCLFPDGYHISMDQLFHYIKGETILAEASTLQAARLHLYVIVNKLISSCMLLQTETGCIMMHDVVRDVALAIASDPREGNGFIVKAGVELNGWPNMQLADCRRLSFITTRGNRMSWNLPNRIQAVHLLTLSFHGNERLVKIPTGFFKETPNLLAVDLSYTGIKVLPQSIMSLGKLHTFLLEGCFCLSDVYVSSTMERLEILSLRYSAVESVMMSRKMTTLKLLDLSYTSKLEHIGHNIISSFIELEELYMFESFRAWEPERIEPEGKSGKVKDRARKDESEGPGASSSEVTGRREDYARLSEVTSLPRLTSLELHVGNLECLFQSIPNWENLTRFRLAVGVIDDFSPFGIDDGMQMEKSMYIELRTKLIANWVKVLLGRTKFLQLKGSQNLIDLLQLDPWPEQQIFRELKVLILREIGPQILSDSSPFSFIKKVVKLSDGVRFTSLIPRDLLVRLQNLNKLVIMNCEYLEKLIQFEEVSMDASSSSTMNVVKFSNISACSVFPNLTYLRVCACAELRYLFPMRIIRGLPQLEMLYISNCRKMEMVIVHETTEDDGKADDERAILPKLKVLSLEGLTSLSHIIQQDVHLKLPVLEELTVNGCGGLQKLPFGPGSVPRLTKLVVSDDDDDWFDALMWDDQNAKQRLCHLLNSLHLKGCKTLKDVELLDRWQPKLRSVRVTDYKGATLIPCNFLKEMSHLTNLVIINSGELEMIDFGEEDNNTVEEVPSVGPSSSPSVSMSKFSKSIHYPVLGNLSFLKVSGCSFLKYLCPMRVIRALLQLEKLYIHDCARMDMVIIIEDEIVEDVGKADDEKAILTKLRVFSLEGLTSLSHVIQQDVHLKLHVLEELTVNGCGGLQKLPFGPGSVPQLTKLVVDDDDWFDALIWEDQIVKQRLYLLNRLHLKGLVSLKDVELLDQWDPTSRSVRVTDYKGSTLIPCKFLKRMPHLMKLVIENCQELQMIDVGEEDETVEEEFLSVGASSSSSTSMSKFFKSRAYPVFANLSCLRVSGCSRLKYLCPMSVVRGLLQLEKLYIHDCARMEMVIEDENAEDEDLRRILPKLGILSLEGLTSLSHIALKDVDLELPALKELKVKGCKKFKIPLCVGSFGIMFTDWEDENQLYLKECTSLKDVESNDSLHPAASTRLRVTDYGGAILVHRSLLWRLWNLETLEVSYCRNLETMVEFGGTNKAGDTSMGARLSSSLIFPNLTILEVARCSKLRYLLPMGAARDMVHLKVLHVSNCDSMEMMIEYENVDDAEKDKAILPKLEELRLMLLPKLWSFVGQDILFDWPSLKELTVSGCPDLKRLPLGPASVPKLNYFYAYPRSWFDSLEWEDEGQELKSRLLTLLPR